MSSLNVLKTLDRRLLNTRSQLSGTLFLSVILPPSVLSNLTRKHNLSLGVFVFVKRPVLPPYAVDGRSKNPLCYYYCVRGKLFYILHNYRDGLILRCVCHTSSYKASHLILLACARKTSVYLLVLWCVCHSYVAIRPMKLRSI